MISLETTIHLFLLNISEIFFYVTHRIALSVTDNYTQTLTCVPFTLIKTQSDVVPVFTRLQYTIQLIQLRAWALMKDMLWFGFLWLVPCYLAQLPWYLCTNELNTLNGAFCTAGVLRRITDGNMQYVKKTHILGIWKREKKRAKMFLHGSGMATVPNSDTTMRFFSELWTYESLRRNRLL